VDAPPPTEPAATPAPPERVRKPLPTVVRGAKRRYAPARRVISIGGVLGRSVPVLLRNLVPFWVISIICYSPVLAYHAFTTPFGVGEPDTTTAGKAIGFLSSGLGFIAAGLMAYGVVQTLRGRSAGPFECIARGTSRVPSVLGTGLLLILYLLVAGVVLVFASIPLMTVILGLSTGILGVLLFAVIILVPIALIQALFWVAVPAAALESKGPKKSLERSKDLTRGNLGAAFGLTVLFAIVGAGVEVLCSELSNAQIRWDFGPQGLRARVTQDLVVATWIPLAVQVLLLGPLTAVASAISYNDLRIAQDGVSLDELARVFD
jgi:hypothetical protein